MLYQRSFCNCIVRGRIHFSYDFFFYSWRKTKTSITAYPMVTKPYRACVFSQYSRDTSSRRETCFVATVLIHPLTSKLPITAVVHFQTDFLILLSFLRFYAPSLLPLPQGGAREPDSWPLLCSANI